jgi:hypothetical protein
MTIKTEHSTIVGANARVISRVSTGLTALPAQAIVSRPTRLDKDGKPVKFNLSEGYAFEEGGAWVANEMNAPLNGFERHAAMMIDSGLCDADDLF